MAGPDGLPLSRACPRYEDGKDDGQRKRNFLNVMKMRNREVQNLTRLGMMGLSI